MSGTGMLAGRAALVLGLDEIGTGIARRFAREGARCVWPTWTVGRMQKRSLSNWALSGRHRSIPNRPKGW